MERVGRDEIQKITVPSSKRTWLRLINGGRASGSTCSLDSSFIPEPGQAYIVRYAELGRRCQVELFRIKPGLAPVRETLVREESRSCLFQ